MSGLFSGVCCGTPLTTPTTPSPMTLRAVLHRRFGLKFNLALQGIEETFLKFIGMTRYYKLSWVLSNNKWVKHCSWPWPSQSGKGDQWWSIMGVSHSGVFDRSRGSKTHPILWLVASHVSYFSRSCFFGATLRVGWLEPTSNSDS